MRLVVLVSSIPGTWRENEKIELNLQSWETNSKPPGPVSRSKSNILRLSMKKYARENCDTISKALADRAWEKRQQVSFQSKNSIFLRSFLHLLKTYSANQSSTHTNRPSSWNRWHSEKTRGQNWKGQNAIIPRPDRFGCANAACKGVEFTGREHFQENWNKIRIEFGRGCPIARNNDESRHTGVNYFCAIFEDKGDFGQFVVHSVIHCLVTDSWCYHK